MATALPHDGFDSTWPALERRLRRVLSRKAVPPWLQDDIVQETGLRLLHKWGAIDPERGPWPFALTIANNLLWDETHRRNGREVVGPVPDQADPVDVARAAMARVELGHVMRALSSLRHNYQTVLLAEIGHSPAFEGSPKAINMLRMRARRRLSALVDRSASTFGFALPAAKSAGVGWRRLTAWAQSHPSSELQTLAPAAAGGLAAITLALAGVTAGGPGATTPTTPMPRGEEPALIRDIHHGTLPASPAVRQGIRVQHKQPQVAPPRERTRTSPPEETTVAAGPARAKAGEDKGSRYVAVCTGENSPNDEDDTETSVTIHGGGQNGESYCSHEEEP